MKIVLETGKEGLHWILETTEMPPGVRDLGNKTQDAGNVFMS